MMVVVLCFVVLGLASSFSGVSRGTDRRTVMRSYVGSTSYATEEVVPSNTIDLVSTELALLRANSNFYAAFRSGDFDRLVATLHDDECISVVHPGIPPLYGRKAVLQSWRSVLAAPPQITPSETRVVQICDGLAWLHCFESLEGTNGVRLAATNIFKRDSSGAWKVVLHTAGSCI